MMLCQESRRINEYLQGSMEQTGQYPKDLSSYSFLYPSLANEINYVNPRGNLGEYSLIWHVGTHRTHHKYSSSRGWEYYPD